MSETILVMKFVDVILRVWSERRAFEARVAKAVVVNVIMNHNLGSVAQTVAALYI